MKKILWVISSLVILIPLNAAALPTAPCNALETLKAKIHLAIYNALKYPANTAFYAATGVTAVKYEYLNGQAGDIHMIGSSGNGILDRAALRAVKNAQYPPASSLFRDKSITDVIYFIFDNSDLMTRNSRATDSGDALRRQLSMDSKCMKM
jgi:periplasmic protein TonB